MSKGSRQRPTSVSDLEYASRWDAIFGKDLTPVSCPCGRSPTSQCQGWHGLSESDYQAKLAEYKVINSAV
jgi:hypothetical protein